MKNNNKTKICLSCKEEKAIESFYIIKEKIDYYCKYCRNKNTINGQFNNKRKCSLDNCDKPHYAKDLCRMHYARKSTTGILDRKQTDINKIFIYNNKKYSFKKQRARHLMSTYKITLDQFDRMSKNGCWICGNKSSGVKRLHVEHDHKCCPPTMNKNGWLSGRTTSCGLCVRGIVCNRCNILIGKYEKGLMRDDNPFKEKVITYLLNYKARRFLI